MVWLTLLHKVCMGTLVCVSSCLMNRNSQSSLCVDLYSDLLQLLDRLCLFRGPWCCMAASLLCITHLTGEERPSQQHRHIFLEHKGWRACLHATQQPASSRCLSMALLILPMGQSLSVLRILNLRGTKSPLLSADATVTRPLCAFVNDNCLYFRFVGPIWKLSIWLKWSRDDPASCSFTQAGILLALESV